MPDPDPAPDRPAGSADPASWVGRRLEVLVGGPAHGGSCVARFEGRAVFVRHALPGERVVALVTGDRGGRFCFADAVEVLVASADRVDPPCPHAGPGRCGGCDWQHADAAAQLELKATVVREQFARLGGLDVSGLLAGVEALPGGLLGWRTRTAYALAGGVRGLHRHASHEIEPVACCPLGVAGVDDPGRALTGVGPAQLAGLTAVEAVRGDTPPVTLLGHRPGRGPRRGHGRRVPDRVERLTGPRRTRHRVLDREFTVSAGGFWQVHPAAAATFTTALLHAVRPVAGEVVLDLYAGAGLLTAALAEAVGPLGRVVGVESSRSAVADAAANLAGLPGAEVRDGRIDARLVRALGAELAAAGGPGGVDVVVLDPPRAGAGRDVIDAVIDAEPRVIGYLSCDPASLARDVAAARDRGWRLESLRAFDAFPMTHHVECLARLEPPDPGAAAPPDTAVDPVPRA